MSAPLRTARPLSAQRLFVCSHKPCWRLGGATGAVVTDGGFPMQMRALAALFAEARVAVPVADTPAPAGHEPLAAPGLTVVPLTPPAGRGLARKLAMLGWTARHLPRLVREMRRADVVHAPIPGDVGTVALLVALALRKPLFVRHCGNWLAPRTLAERLWVRLLERVAGGRVVVLATGGTAAPPSARNPHIGWIFATSLRDDELARLAALERPAAADAPRLVIACRQDERKGTRTVLEALPALRAACPGTTLDVVGDGPALPALREAAAALGVADAVRFHGRCTHDAVLHHLAAADLFVYPTRASEGFPKVVLEALAAGLPVCCTRVSVLPQLVTPDVGVLLDEATPAAVVAAVVPLLRDPGRRAALSAAARRRARAYSLEAWRGAIGARLAAAWGTPEAARAS